MRHLDKPTEDVRDVFLDCISGISDAGLYARLAACVDVIENEARKYDNKASTNEFHTLTRKKSTKANKFLYTINGKVTINEMKDVYTSYFAKMDSPGRKLYDKLLSLPFNSKCPFCFHRLVSNLDHYLPKAYYPLLSITPINLVPSCKDCNTAKLSAYPSNSFEEILHPYYDNVQDELWLKAKVQQTSPVSIYFYVEPPDGWTNTLKKRVKFHFDSFSLNLLYGAEAATELVNIRHQLRQLFTSGDSRAVKSHLIEHAESRENAYKNSWSTAMYTAVSGDDWFCNGGFNL